MAWVKGALENISAAAPGNLMSVDEAIHTLDEWLMKAHRSATKGAQHTSPFIRMAAVRLGMTALEGWAMWIEQNKPYGGPVGPATPGEMVTLVEATLIAKHSDYGNASLIRFGVFGFIVKTDMKVSRLRNLIGKDTGPANEPIADTWLDIVGYATLLYMYTKDQIK